MSQNSRVAEMNLSHDATWRRKLQKATYGMMHAYVIELSKKMKRQVRTKFKQMVPSEGKGETDTPR